MKSTLIIYGLLILFTVSPLLSAATAIKVASAYGSSVDEGGSHPCIIRGKDYGDLLNLMFVAGWLSLITIPAGLLALLAFTICLIIKKVKNKPAPSVQ